MFIKRMQPSFTYDNHQIIFNYCIQNILIEVINKNKEKLIDVNGVKVLIFDKDSFIVYVSPDLNRTVFDNISNVPNINNYNFAVGHALNNEGVFLKINGMNPLELAEELSEHTDLSLNYILDTYKSNFAEIDDIDKINCGKFLSESIPNLYKLAKEK